MLLLDDDEVLPEQPTAAESDFRDTLGVAGIASLERAILACTQATWLKVARVVHDALSSNGFDASDEVVCLHARTVATLVARGELESKGDLKRPRWSEIRLAGCEDER